MSEKVREIENIVEDLRYFIGGSIGNSAADLIQSQQRELAAKDAENERLREENAQLCGYDSYAEMLSVMAGGE